jgi:hypothetical protein
MPHRMGRQIRFWPLCVRRYRPRLLATSGRLTGRPEFVTAWPPVCVERDLSDRSSRREGEPQKSGASVTGDGNGQPTNGAESIHGSLGGTVIATPDEAPGVMVGDSFGASSS